MKNFVRKLTVKWRLVGFVSFLLLLIIGAGLGGLNGMRSVNNSLSEVYEHQVLPFDQLRQIDYIFQSGIVNTIDKTLFEQITWADGIKALKESKFALDVKWANLQATCMNVKSADQGTPWLDQGNAIIAATDDTFNQLILFLENNDIDNLDITPMKYSIPSLKPIGRQLIFSSVIVYRQLKIHTNNPRKV